MTRYQQLYQAYCELHPLPDAAKAGTVNKDRLRPLRSHHQHVVPMDENAKPCPWNWQQTHHQQPYVSRLQELQEALSEDLCQTASAESRSTDAAQNNALVEPTRHP